MSAAVNDTDRRNFLLEIGSEEIPARFIPTALSELASRLDALLTDSHLEHGPVRTLATPRRLAALCDGVALRQPDREELVKGPPVRVAFDADGAPTKAGEGFARKVGLDIADCERVADGKGEYLQARTRIPGRTADEVLGEALPELILGLPFRKVMRWGAGEIEYARPLQWLVCLLGPDVVPFTVGDLASGRTTRGHRTLTEDRRRDLAASDEYLAAMAELCVTVDHEERRRAIVDQAAAVLAGAGEPAAWREDEELLTEVVFLCEQPTAFRGSFEPEYFELPDEVIVTALKAHQRYFAIDDPAGGGLRPGFLAVRDGGRDHLEAVVAGNERVLRARLADALFYWRFDQQRSPDEHAAALASVTWLEGFGSLRDRTERIAALVDRLWKTGLGGAGEAPADLRRAARICKFDQVTEMIRDGKEFTKLEGVIGARYAAAAGESEAVCRLIEGHLQPRSAVDEPPADRDTGVLAVADRLDAIAGCWLAGFVPTGAKDPYALRRHALAVLRILLAHEARVDLGAVLDAALAPYAALRPHADLAAARTDLADFFRRRFEGELVDQRGAAPAVVRAVLSVGALDPVDLVDRIGALDRFRDREDFLLLATGFKRCKNILKGDLLAAESRQESLRRWQEGGRGADGEDLAGLPEPAERELVRSIAEAVPALLADEAHEAYLDVFQTLSGFGPAIDRFFDEVRVNAEEEDLRRRRHALLREIHALFVRFADISHVAPGEEEEDR